MSGHRHNPNAGTQNQGNSLGDRSCVRQSKLYRMYESGNDVKAILGSGHLAWDPNYKQGAYAGQKVFDHEDNGSHTYGNRSSSNISASNSNYARNNDENRYPPKNTLSHYARDDDYSYQQPKRSGGAVPSYDDDYAPRAAVGGRGNSSGGGPSSFMIGQTDYSGGRGDDSRSNYHRRTSNEPTASGNDTYPMNKMGTSARATEDYRRAPVEESSYPLNKMNGGGGSSGGYRRGVRDEDENEGDNYPLSKMNQSGSGYRNAKEQMNYNSSNSNFQPARGGSGGKSSEIVARSYFPPQQPQSDRDRSTRPW